MNGTFNQYKYVFQMQLLRNIGFFVFLTLIMVLVSIGIVIGFTYLIPDPGKESILFLATGAPTVIFIMTGLVILPQQIGQSKADGYLEYIRTWPVKRSVILYADTTIWLIFPIPGIIVSTIVAHFMFSPGYAISWKIVPVLFCRFDGHRDWVRDILFTITDGFFSSIANYRFCRLNVFAR